MGWLVCVILGVGRDLSSPMASKWYRASGRIWNNIRRLSAEAGRKVLESDFDFVFSN